MNLESVIAPLLRGLVNGSLIALIALGYTLVYGIVELINFAHGDVFMIGALTGFSLITLIPGFQSGQGVTDYPLPVTLLVIAFIAVVVAILCAALNFGIDYFAYKPLRNAPRLAPLITAIGVSFILQNVGLLWHGSIAERYPISFPNSSGQPADLLSDVLGIKTKVNYLPLTAVVILVVTVPLFLGLRYLINHTRIGKAMRAVAQNREAAALMGININQTIGYAFLLGGALAGIAGVIYGIHTNGGVKYNLGFQNGLYAFTAAVLGGIGNINGAILGGLFIGLVNAIAQTNLFGLINNVSLSEWSPALVFGILVLVLVFKPSGLLGENVPEKV